MAAVRRSTRKTARQRLEINHPSHGKSFAVPANMRRSMGAGTMIVPRPLDVEAAMRLPRKGRVITLTQIRARLARAAGVDLCCPLTTGIVVRLAARAAEEDLAAGKARVTPYWRTVRDDGQLNEKFPGGAKAQAKKLRLEGHTILPGKGKQPPRVADVGARKIR